MSPLIAHLDETDRGEKMLGVGGLVVPSDRLLAVTESWLKLRETFGLPEVKWGALNSVQRREVIDFIVDQELWVMCDVLIDDRTFSRGAKQRPARDHYRWGLTRCAYWVAMIARETKEPGPHQVVVDTVPTPPTIDKQYDGDRRLDGLRSMPKTYAHHHYAELWATGASFPMNTPLGEQCFYPALLSSDATTNVLLELADVSVGCVARWAFAEIEAAPDSRLEALVEALAPAMVVLPKTLVLLDIICGYGTRCGDHHGVMSRLPRQIQKWSTAP